MRFYNVTRFGAYKIRYAEVGQFRASANELLTIPSPVPKQLDPFLLWKQTERREPFRILEIQDKTGHTWFEIKSAMPLSKILEISKDTLHEMQ